MPELPEVETIKNMIKGVLLDSVIEDIEIRQRKFREVIPDNFEKIAKGAKVINLKRKIYAD